MMGLKRWISGAVGSKHTWHVTPANVEVGDVFTISAGNVAVSFTATSASVANVTAGLTAAWAASVEGPALELAASDATTHVVLEGKIAGLPCPITTSTVDGGGSNTQTLTANEIVASTGPYHWDEPANWVEGAAPVAGDDVLLAVPMPIMYGLDHTGTTFASLVATAAFTSWLGLPVIRGRNTDLNIPAYTEHRNRWLQAGITVGTIGEYGSNTGSPLVRIKNETVQTLLRVWSTGLSYEPSAGAVVWSGTNVNNVLQVSGGRVDVYDTATIKHLYVSGSGECRCSALVTFGTDVSVLGGLLRAASTIPSLLWTGGIFVRAPGCQITAWDYSFGEQRATAT